MRSDSSRGSLGHQQPPSRPISPVLLLGCLASGHAQEPPCRTRRSAATPRGGPIFRPCHGRRAADRAREPHACITEGHEGPVSPARPPEAAGCIEQKGGVAGREAACPASPLPAPRRGVGRASSQPAAENRRSDPVQPTAGAAAGDLGVGGGAGSEPLEGPDGPGKPVSASAHSAMAFSLALVLDRDQASRKRKRGLISSALRRGTRKSQAGPLGSWESGCFSPQGPPLLCLP